MKHFILFLLSFVLASASYAGNNWTEYLNNGTIKVSYRYVDCNDAANGIKQQKIILRFENLTDKKAEVSFERKLYYSNAQPTTGDLKTFHLNLEPNQTTEGECDVHDKALVIFVKHLNIQGTELKKFELNDVSVVTKEQ